MIRIFILSFALAISACSFERRMPDGNVVKCVGLGEDDQQDMRYIYGISSWNITMGVLFVTLIVPPVTVIADGWKCPERPRKLAPVTQRNVEIM